MEKHKIKSESAAFQLVRMLVKLQTACLFYCSCLATELPYNGPHKRITSKDALQGDYFLKEPSHPSAE